jgi:hypothetical protein
MSDEAALVDAIFTLKGGRSATKRPGPMAVIGASVAEPAASSIHRLARSPRSEQIGKLTSAGSITETHY